MTGPMMIANSLTLFLSFSLSPPFLSLTHTLSLSHNHSLYHYFSFFLLLPFSSHHFSKLFALTDMLEILANFYNILFFFPTMFVRIFPSFLFLSFFFQSLFFFHFFFSSLLISLSARSICKLRR